MYAYGNLLNMATLETTRNIADGCKFCPFIVALNLFDITGMKDLAFMLHSHHLNCVKHKLSQDEKAAACIVPTLGDLATGLSNNMQCTE